MTLLIYAFQEEFQEVKDNLQSLKEKFKSSNNTILKNPVPIQINNTTPPTYTDNPIRSTILSQISQSINESIKRVNNIFVFNLQEQSYESHKNTIMNLCIFILDHEITCKSTSLNKKGKIRPVKIVFPDAIVKNPFMQNLNKLKNSPDQYKNFSINYDMTVDEWKNERLLQDIGNEKKKKNTIK